MKKVSMLITVFGLVAGVQASANEPTHYVFSKLQQEFASAKIMAYDEVPLEPLVCTTIYDTGGVGLKYTMRFKRMNGFFVNIGDFGEFERTYALDSRIGLYSRYVRGQPNNPEDNVASTLRMLNVDEYIHEKAYKGGIIVRDSPKSDVAKGYKIFSYGLCKKQKEFDRSKLKQIQPGIFVLGMHKNFDGSTSYEMPFVQIEGDLYALAADTRNKNNTSDGFCTVLDHNSSVVVSARRNVDGFSVVELEPDGSISEFLSYRTDGVIASSVVCK